MKDILKNRVSLAPMVDRTDYNFRHFIRLLSPNITLYTEMITDKAIINSKKDLLVLDQKQNPIVLQIATNNPQEAKEALKNIYKYDYDEINLNVGCPSDRVSQNNMGAYLMSDVDLVVNIINEIKEVTNLPITIKNRIGIDGKGILPNDERYYGYDFLHSFIEKINNTGVNKFIIHAREAILRGLSPKQNRSIPPLEYNIVYEIKKNMPDLFIEINGGIKTIENIKEHLQYVDATMIGREIYSNPMFVVDIENEIYNNRIIKSRENILMEVIKYLEDKKFNELEIHRYLMHTQGLYFNTKQSKKWKQLCSSTKTNIEDIKKFIESSNI